MSRTAASLFLCVLSVSNAEDSGATYVRDFRGDPPTQEFSADASQVKFLDELVIIDFTQSNQHATYKIVLAGIVTTQHETMLMGTLFMYLDGVLASGMYIRFRRSGE